MGGWMSQPTAGPPPELFSCEEWRTIQWGEAQKRHNLQHVKSYRPHNKEIQQLRILVHGPTGAGKSSFINSVDTVLQGRMTGRALTDAISRGSFTIKHATYKIQKEVPGVFYPFAFTDIMGLDRDTNRGVSVEDITLAMEGHVKDGYKFNPVAPLTKDDDGYNHTPSLNDKVHVLVCVISAGTMSILSDESITKMREVRLAASAIGIPQLAILTKIDEACPSVKADIKNVYKSARLKKHMEKVSVALGIPICCIFPVKSYHAEISPDDNVDTLILSALRQMIDFGEDFVNDL